MRERVCALVRLCVFVSACASDDKPVVLVVIHESRFIIGNGGIDQHFTTEPTLGRGREAKLKEMKIN